MRVPSMFILSAALLSINCDQCEPMERAIATSPDDAFSAVERLYDCGGGTVAASTSVSVRPSPSAKQAYSEADVLGLRGDVSVTIEWTGPRALKLTVAPEAEVTAFRPKLDGLAVTLERSR